MRFPRLTLLLCALAAAVLSAGCLTGSLEVPPAPTPTATPAPSPTPLATEPPSRIVNTSRPARLVIDRLGVDSSLVTMGLDANRVPEVPDYSNSRSPRTAVAWYDWSAIPGQASNAVFAGHVTFDGPGIFYHLDAVRPGDTVKVVTEDGKTLTYTVFETVTVDPSRVDLILPTNDDIVTVITCGGGQFVQVPGEAYGGHYPGRVVVRAALTQVA